MSARAEVGVDHVGTRGTAQRSERGWEVELHAGSGRLDVATTTHLIRDLVDAIGQAGGGIARWRVAVATPEHHRIARAAGFTGDRRLVQMRRPLPTPWTTDLPTRAFEVGQDEDAWLTVNNAAFAWHPEQSDWTRDMLAARVAEPWFDPAGFLVHPPDGPILGFCWTKVHRDLDPPIGEIFVIGVSPAASGRGLGRELVLAGLAHLAGLGLTEAMLYTELDNRRALELYQRLGFTVHHEVTVFERSDADPDE